MKTIAGLIVISLVLAGAATVASTPVNESHRSVPELKTEAPLVDNTTTLKSLELRFGRDTLLYFPMDHGTAAPVALQQFVDIR